MWHVWLDDVMVRTSDVALMWRYGGVTWQLTGQDMVAGDLVVRSQDMVDVAARCGS